MKKSIAMAAIAATLLFGHTQHAANADVTVSSHMTFTGPFVDQMQKQGKGNAFSQFSEMRTYASAKHFRIDMGLTGMIVNLETKKMLTLNNTAHTYTEADFDPLQSKDLMGRMFGTKSVYTNIVDTGKTTQYMGHQVKHYTADVAVTLTMPNLPPNMQNMTQTVDILAAQDMPAEDKEMLATFSAMFGTPEKLKGLTLMMRSTYTSGFMNGTVVNVNATAVSTKPIDSAIFDIPAGFTKAEPKPAAPAPAVGV